MAQRKTYRCKQCGYECYDYEGTGFMRQHIVSVSCPDCHTIQPLVVGGIIGNNAPSFNGPNRHKGCNTEGEVHQELQDNNKKIKLKYNWRF